MAASDAGQHIDLVSPSKPNDDVAGRRYKHSLNRDGGVDSFCLQCHKFVTNATNEWDLMDEEEVHICVEASSGVER
jgi:hypothetical protein